MTDDPAADSAPAWSPDGTRLAFVSERSGDADVWVAAADGTGQTPLVDEQGADLAPSWSPAGTRLVYTHDGLVRVAAADGALSAPLASGAEPSWGHAVPPPPPPLAAPPPPPPPPSPAELLPELDQRAPSDLSVQRAGGRFLLGFTSATDNVGTGPLWIRGERPLPRGDMAASQLIRRADGSVRVVRDVGRIRYTWSASHSHFHLLRFQRFELRRAADFALVARDRKTGFCLADHYGLARHRVRTSARRGFSATARRAVLRELRVEQGSSPGYTDRYPAHFHGQNVDVTGLRPGVYVLVHRANADGRLRERTLANNAASLRLRLTWPRGRRAAPRIAVLRVCEGRERC